MLFNGVLLYWMCLSAEMLLQHFLHLICPFMCVQIGQATTIHHWVFEDGTEGGPATAEVVESTEKPSDEEVSQAGGLSVFPQLESTFLELQVATMRHEFLPPAISDIITT